MAGTWVVRIAFAAALFSSVAYYMTLRAKKAEWARAARLSFFVAAAGVILASAMLLIDILTHQFQYTYVWSYSSTDLSTPLLISTFYAGQEGSFLLWALYTAVIGIVLMSYSRKKGIELQVLTVFALIQAVLLLLVVVKNPFEYVWQSFAGEAQAGSVPENGRGLNPLLQNFWMVIHPPILFTGFAAMSVPFAFAVAGLWRREYQAWITSAAPWMLFAVVTLGAGIMLGGYWAYETLGWGGYWGWDPVENSSFIPWLFAVGAVHTMLAQRKTGRYIRSTFVLSILGFLLVLYSTFLTRSGVLGETSVHSFGEPGMGVYALLVGLIVLFTAIGFIAYFNRVKEIPKPAGQRSYWSREFLLYLGAMILIALGLYVLVGTSAPLITGFFQAKPSAVDISFYPKGAVPLSIIISLLIAISQLIWWQRSEPKVVVRSMIYPAGAAVLATVALFPFGLNQVAPILVVFGAFFGLFANLVAGYRIFRGNPRYVGGALAHIGVGVMLLGFVGSSQYDTKQTISLPQGETVEALGYKLTYLGNHRIEGEKFAFDVKVERDGKGFTLTPVMFYSEYNKGIMRNPDIAMRATYDFYIEPQSLEQPQQSDPGTQLVLKKGETKEVAGYRVTFVDFQVDRSAMMAGDPMGTRMPPISAKLLVERAGKSEAVVPSFKILQGGNAEAVPAWTADRTGEFQILTLQPDREKPEKSSVTLAVRTGAQPAPTQTRETLIIEASVKPFVGFVWLGTLVLICGVIVSLIRRAKEARQQ